MSERGATIDRLSPMRRPERSPVGFQTWSDLLFVHWRLAPSEIEPLLPRTLTLDTFDGAAWVGLVPFRMSRVRPWWSPPLPGISWFLETNVRTYVHRQGDSPGVWFFSLEASKGIAVQIARWKWLLNYYCAAMQFSRTGTTVRYSSERLWPGPPGAHCTIQAEVGDLIGALNKDLPPGQAVPGTLEHFLAERYLLYTVGPSGRLLRGQVHHTPYPLREARLVRLKETLLKASRIQAPAMPEHVLFSEGVRVEIFGLDMVPA
jgi:uncharacterized protein